MTLPPDTAALVERLADWLPPGNVFSAPWCDETHADCQQAAATIKAQARWIKELRAALGPFSAVLDENVPAGIALPSVSDYRRARQAYASAVITRANGARDEGEGK